MQNSAAIPSQPPAAGWPGLSSWLLCHGRAGFLVGLGIGSVFQVLIYLRDDKIDRHLVPIAALLNGAVWSLAALAAGLLAAPLGAKRLRGGRVLSLALLAVLLFIHGVSLWIRWLTGTFPSLAPILMFLDSPEQFLRAGLVGQAAPAAVLLLATAAVGFVFWRLLAPPYVSRGGLSRLLIVVVLLAGSLVAIVAAPPLSDAVQMLQVATPEVRWLVLGFQTLSDLDEGRSHLAVPRGAPLAAAEEWRQLAASGGGPRPNVLLILLESVPGNHVGYQGYGRPVTPNLDRLAGGGWQFRRAYSTATQSNYAQTAILASLLPLRQRYLETYVQLDYPRFLFHDLFAQLGYDTATISSQNENWQGLRRFQTTATPNDFFHSLDHPGPHLGRGAERKLPDHLTVDHLLTWLEGKRGRGKPWAVYLNLQRTHFPYELPQGLSGAYQPSEPTLATFSFLGYPLAEVPIVRNRYDNALAYVDQQIGRVVEYLERTQQRENTLIAIAADHGELFGEGGYFTHAKGLDEVQVRVPMLLSWPGKLAPRVTETAVSTLDLLPTLVDLLGLPPHPAFQGRSLSDPERYEAAHVAHFLTLQSLSTTYGVVCWPWKLLAYWSESNVTLFRVDDGYEERILGVDDSDPMSHALLDLVLSQRQAQLDYYQGDDGRRRREFQPRLLTCPDVAPLAQRLNHGVDRAAAPR